MSDVNFKCSAEDMNLILAIVERTQRNLPVQIEYEKIDNIMDLNACHANGCPLRLGALLEAEATDFWHDVLGIRRHINRNTGKLEDCFIPRYYDSEGAQS